jgi:putative ABC transport system permease protein
MKTSLAWNNLVHHRMRTATALAGVAFAVILIFMQMGFKEAIKKTATQIYDALDFDLLLRSSAYIHLTDARSFPRTRVYQAASVPGVTTVRPFYLGLSDWQKPTKADADSKPWDGQWRGIITMATDPVDPAFRSDLLRAKARLLTDPQYILIDSKSKPEYGPANGQEFGDKDLHVQTMLGTWPIRIIGHFKLGTGLAANGACMTNPEGYAQACPWQPIEMVTFGLVKLDDSVPIESVQTTMQKMFSVASVQLNDETGSSSIDVLTRAEVNSQEQRRWVEETPLGKIFNLGVWIALFVGVAIVYQVLSSDISNMISEYATLKAMGYSNFYLTSVVLGQSVLLALVGFIPSAFVSWLLYVFVRTASGMPMEMTWKIMLTVFLLSVVMCMLSGMAALRKLFQADPADLF